MLVRMNANKAGFKHVSPQGYRAMARLAGMGAGPGPNESQALAYEAQAERFPPGSAAYNDLMARAAQLRSQGEAPAAPASSNDGWFASVVNTVAGTVQSTGAAGGIFVPELNRYVIPKSPPPPGTPLNPPDLTEAEYQQYAPLRQTAGLSPIMKSMIDYYKAYVIKGYTVMKDPAEAKKKGGSILDKITSIFSGKEKDAAVDAGKQAVIGAGQGAVDYYLGTKTPIPRTTNTMKADGVDTGDLVLWAGGTVAVCAIGYSLLRSR